MKYPRLYNSLDEFERMELRNGNAEWSIDAFFNEVLETNGSRDDFEEEEEEDEY
jgi:hypothetical protein